MSKWIDHVKNFSASNGVSYKCALSDAECRRTYQTATSGGAKQFNKKANYVKYMQSRDEFDITKITKPSANLIQRYEAKRAKQPKKNVAKKKTSC